MLRVWYMGRTWVACAQISPFLHRDYTQGKRLCEGPNEHLYRQYPTLPFTSVGYWKIILRRRGVSNAKKSMKLNWNFQKSRERRKSTKNFHLEIIRIFLQQQHFIYPVATSRSDKNLLCACNENRQKEKK